MISGLTGHMGSFISRTFPSHSDIRTLWFILWQLTKHNTYTDAASPGKSVQAITTTTAKRPGLMTWLMPEWTALWGMCAALTPLWNSKTPLLITKPWASYGFWHQCVGRCPVGVLESSECQTNPKVQYQVSMSTLSLISFKMFFQDDMQLVHKSFLYSRKSNI